MEQSTETSGVRLRIFLLYVGVLLVAAGGCECMIVQHWYGPACGFAFFCGSVVEIFKNNLAA